MKKVLNIIFIVMFCLLLAAAAIVLFGLEATGKAVLKNDDIMAAARAAKAAKAAAEKEPIKEQDNEKSSN
jgi:flagellar basal body-associated protein FliL